MAHEPSTRLARGTYLASLTSAPFSLSREMTSWLVNSIATQTLSPLPPMPTRFMPSFQSPD